MLIGKSYLKSVNLIYNSSLSPMSVKHNSSYHWRFFAHLTLSDKKVILSKDNDNKSMFVFLFLKVCLKIYILYEISKDNVQKIKQHANYRFLYRTFFFLKEMYLLTE